MRRGARCRAEWAAPAIFGRVANFFVASSHPHFSISSGLELAISCQMPGSAPDQWQIGFARLGDRDRQRRDVAAIGIDGHQGGVDDREREACAARRRSRGDSLH